MPPDPGRYEERYRPAHAVAGVVTFLITTGLAFLAVAPWVTGVVIAAGLLIMVGSGVAARRAVAFRADYAGITLGVAPGMRMARGPAVAIPWADVEKIILYRARHSGQGPHEGVRCIGVQRREGAAALPRGNEQAPGCAVPGVAAGAARRITGWRLDRERLAAVTAAVAPGVPIVDAGTGPSLDTEGRGQIDGPGQDARTPELGPAE
jgi:hypothetical protein